MGHPQLGAKNACLASTIDRPKRQVPEPAAGRQERVVRDEVGLVGSLRGELRAAEAHRLAATVAGIAEQRSGGRSPTWQEVDTYIEEALVRARRIETAVAFALRQTQEVPPPAHINGVAEASISFRPSQR